MQLGREELFDCINSLRRVYTRTRDRKPLSFDRQERRGAARIALRVPVRITPVALEDGEIRIVAEVDSAICADTTNLSLRGIAFTHARPLSHPHAAITFRVPGKSPVSLLAELRWTSRNVDAGFETGARFIGLTELPAGILPDGCL
jgi:hypothetical protein